MKYRDVLQLLNRRGNEVLGIHLGLQRMQTLMEAFGNPQRRAPVIHIAGTNGKGSVAATSESILRHSGLKTGLYTSPHLVRLEERIRISGVEISRQQLAEVASRVRGMEKRLSRRGLLDRHLTYFEFITACAFVHFAECRVEAAVVEVGLGGRLDATNVVDPAVCIITGVSYDHQNLLGRTLAQIAREKAGIIKAGVPVISGCKSGPARLIVRNRAREAGATLVEIDRDCPFRVLSERRGHYTVDLRTPLRHYGRLRSSLAGEHQIRNVALAVAAIEALPQLRIGVSAIRRGVSATYWPGRMEEYHEYRRTLLDGAHNPDGASLLANHLEKHGPAQIHLVFGAMRDKDIRKMGMALFPLARTIHLTPLSNPRSAMPEEIQSIHPRFGARFRIHQSAVEALRAAWEGCPRNGLVVVAGSLYLLGEIIPLLQRHTR